MLVLSTSTTGVLKATEYRNRCLQVNLPMTDTRGSEDCLYLNIWVPHGSSGKENAESVREMTGCRFGVVLNGAIWTFRITLISLSLSVY